MVGKTRAEAEATRERLLDAAEDAFLEQGVSRTSLEAIARSAGLSRGAIYWHFRDKAALFEAMLDRVRPPLGDLIDGLSRDSDGDPVETLRRLCRFAVDQITSQPRHQRVYTILFHRCERVGDINPAVARQDELIDELLALLEQQFRRARALGRMDPAMPPRIAAEALHAYLAGLYSQYLRDPRECDLDNYAAHFIEAFLGRLLDPAAPDAAPATPPTTGTAY